VSGEPVKWVAGLIAVAHFDPGELTGPLARIIGPAERRFGPWPFSRTEYYRPEMGPGLVRYWLSAAGLGDACDLPRIKRECMALEDRFRRSAADGGGRRVNIDPGYLTAAKFVLASHKNFAHRLAVGQGVFAELTLCFSRSGVVCHDWTYPDIRSGEYDDALRTIRTDFMNNTRPE
jgi:hypothetical protein